MQLSLAELLLLFYLLFFMCSKRAGIRIMSAGGIGRRERFILSIALGAGLGVTLAPQWTQNNLWPETEDMSSGLRGFRNAVILTLSTGYRCAAACHMFSNPSPPPPPPFPPFFSSFFLFLIFTFSRLQSVRHLCLSVGYDAQLVPPYGRQEHQCWQRKWLTCILK